MNEDLQESTFFANNIIENIQQNICMCENYFLLITRIRNFKVKVWQILNMDNIIKKYILIIQNTKGLPVEE
jgi:hypothetical protein